MKSFWHKRTSRAKRLPQLRILHLALLFLASILIHFVIVYNSPSHTHQNKNKSKATQVNVRIVEKKPKIDKDPENNSKKILEVKQAQTEPPEKSQYHGHQDHKVEKETRVKPTPKMPGMDPGSATKQNAAQSNPSPVVPPELPKTLAQEIPPVVNKNQSQQIQPKKEAKNEVKTDASGKVQVSTSTPEPLGTPNPITSFLPKASDLGHQMNQGYQDYVDESLELGDRIDINTSDYRYIGYFTSMRKAIELVWVYPSVAAHKGHQGVVGLQFTIHKSGQVENLRVINSSGYKTLDNSIVNAIKDASPFSPLPEGFKKQKMTITGNFRYLLNSFANGH